MNAVLAPHSSALKEENSERWWEALTGEEGWLWRRLLVLLVYVSIFLAQNVQVAVLLLKYAGQHIVSPDPIVFSDSLDQDIEAMNDTTSISEFGVETLRGFAMLMTMSLGAAAILLWFALSGPKRPRNYGNLLGYALVALVGIFGDQLPGATPRRNYNPVFIWTVASSTTDVIHLTSAAIFLFVPILATAWWLFERRHQLSSLRLYGWAACYAVVFCINVTYGAMALWAPQTDISRGGWFLWEISAFGCTFLVYAAFESWRMLVARSHTGYSPLESISH